MKHGTESVRQILEANRWVVGYCRGGGAEGAYLLLWPLGDGLWDLEFSFPVDFDGSNGEEVIVISRHDSSAVRTLEGFHIQWSPSPEASAAVIVRVFPKSRAATEVLIRDGKERGSSIEYKNVSDGDPWGGITSTD